MKEGDIVSANSPFGNFPIKDREKEMVYVGGGEGKAPLKAYISYYLKQ